MFHPDLLARTSLGKNIASHMINAAKEMLNNNSLNINQVSQMLGFEYPQHFVRFFKAHTGKTPSQYRSA